MTKIGVVVFELCERTDKQTYSSQNFAPLPGTKKLVFTFVTSSGSIGDGYASVDYGRATNS